MLKVFLSALKISCLERILNSDGKVTNFLQISCPGIHNIKSFGAEYANVLIQRTQNLFWKDVFKHIKILLYKCKPVSFSEFGCESLFYNINICRNSNVVYIKQFVEKGILKINQLMGPNGYLSYKDFKTKFPDCDVNFVLYEGIVSAVKQFQRRCGFDFEPDVCTLQENCGKVWKCVAKGSRSIYQFLIKCDTPIKGIEKWSNEFNCSVDTNSVFTRVMKTTADAHLRWFQFRILHRILPTQKLLHSMKITNSSFCVFCGTEEDSLIHMFWSCDKIQNFWEDYLHWLKNNFAHCTQITLSGELIILGKKDNVYTDKIFDLLLLLAKNYIFVCKNKNVAPHIEAFIKIAKHRFFIERQINLFQAHKFTINWALYANYFEAFL